VEVQPVSSAPASRIGAATARAAVRRGTSPGYPRCCARDA